MGRPRCAHVVEGGPPQVPEGSRPQGTRPGRAAASPTNLGRAYAPDGGSRSMGAVHCGRPPGSFTTWGHGNSAEHPDPGAVARAREEAVRHHQSHGGIRGQPRRSGAGLCWPTPTGCSVSSPTSAPCCPTRSRTPPSTRTPPRSSPLGLPMGCVRPVRDWLHFRHFAYYGAGIALVAVGSFRQAKTNQLAVGDPVTRRLMVSVRSAGARPRRARSVSARGWRGDHARSDRRGPAHVACPPTKHPLPPIEP